MNESSKEKGKYLVSDISDLDKEKHILSTTDDQIKKCHSLNKYFVNHKNISPFKLKLIKDIHFMDKKIKLFTFLKFCLGFIILVIPLFIIIYFICSDYSIMSKYIFFPYFLSLSLVMGSFLILLVIRLGDACRNYGIFIVSWERIYIFKILKLIMTGLFLLWLLFLCEEFIINFNLLREKVAQSNNKEDSSSKIFDKGTYSIRLLFILFLWDTEKNEKGSYNHDKIGYFEYEGTFFKDFHYSLSKLLIPIMCLCFFYLLKIFFIKTKREIIYGILFFFSIFKCLYFLINKPSKEETNDEDNKDHEEIYFKNNKGKYLEIIPMTIIILILIVLNFKRCIIDLRRKKFYSYHTKKKNNFVFYMVVTSFVLNTLGYLLFLFLLYLMYFKEIKSDFSISTYKKYWGMIYISFSFILIGYSFPFGDYCFKLIYYPTAYETYDHDLKNQFYIKSSGNLRKNFNYYQKKEKEKILQSNSSF